MVLMAANATPCGPKVAQWNGGCWEVVTAVGSKAYREPAATTLELAQGNTKADCRCQCGRMRILEHVHTNRRDQEIRRTLLERFYLIPCAAAGWKRQVSDRVRREEGWGSECPPAIPGVLND
jgi:hypothetical protein